MDFNALYSRFPEIAVKETRTITLFNHPKLPTGDYGLIELYCEDPDCDCRKVIISVLMRNERKEPIVIASLSYGWEDRAYYQNWYGGDDFPVDDILGANLNLASPQSIYADDFLKVFKEEVLVDKQYVERIKKHYTLFKKDLTNQPKVPVYSGKRKIGRNDPCHCGSGKKYKKCCG